MEPRDRLSVLGLALLWGVLLTPWPSLATVYLTEEQALRSLMPQANGFKKEVVRLSRDQMEQVQGLLGKRLRDDTYTFHTGVKEETVIGYALILETIGKEQPITFMVAVDTQGRVMGIEIMIYRESQGSEIRSRGFAHQYLGKTIKAPLQLGRDVDAISGATLSSRAATYTVKKALALVSVAYGVTFQEGP